jgi:hypothetical protein
MNSKFYREACACVFYQSIRNAVLTIGACVLWVAAPVFAQSVDIGNEVPGVGTALPMNERYPAGSIVSSAVAEQALMDMRRERTRIAGLSAAEERACFAEFFTTACLTDVKERWRAALAEVRLIEAEAKKTKRRLRSSEKEAASAAKKSARVAEPGLHINATDAASAVLAGTDARNDQGKGAKVLPTKASDVHQQTKRAKKVAAYAEKARASKARLQEIAAKKAAKQAAKKAKECAAPC